MTEYIVYIVLGIVIVVLAAERYFIVEQHQRERDKLLEENSRLVKAIISKNANEYVMTTSIDKVAPEKPIAVTPDTVPEEALSDEQFFDAIGKGLKAT